MAYLHKAVNRSCIIIIVAIFYCVYGEAQTFIFFIFVSLFLLVLESIACVVSEAVLG